MLCSYHDKVSERGLSGMQCYRSSPSMSLYFTNAFRWLLALWSVSEAQVSLSW